MLYSEPACRGQEVDPHVFLLEVLSDHPSIPKTRVLEVLSDHPSIPKTREGVNPTEEVPEREPVVEPATQPAIELEHTVVVHTPQTDTRRPSRATRKPIRY